MTISQPAEEFIAERLKSLFGDRIWPDVAPEDEKFEQPGVVYQANRNPVNTQDLGYIGLNDVRCNIDVYGQTRKAVRDAVLKAIPLLTTHPVQVGYLHATRDLYDDIVRRYRTQIDISIWEDV